MQDVAHKNVISKIMRTTTLKKMCLLLVPMLLPVAGMIALTVMADATKGHIVLALLLTIGASLINVAPFVFLFVIHFFRVRNKTGPRNCSFYTAYLPAILTMLTVILLLLRETTFGRPGSQFIGAGFFSLPRLTIPIMLVGYIVGWVIEWGIRRRHHIYIVEDASTRRKFLVHLSKYKVIYIIILALIAADILLSLGYSLLLSTGMIPWYGIHEAAESGNTRQVKQFIDKGAEVNSRNEDGDTTLHLAALYDSKKMIELLIANGAVVDAKNNIGETPLHNAAWAGETTTVGALLEHGADVNAKDNYGDTPLHEAVRKGHKNIVKILLAHEANMNIQNNRGQTPLAKAVFWGYKDLTELLIEQGAEVNIADKKGRTPLSIAIEEKYKGIEELLRYHGARE